MYAWWCGGRCWCIIVLSICRFMSAWSSWKRRSSCDHTHTHTHTHTHRCVPLAKVCVRISLREVSEVFLWARDAGSTASRTHWLPQTLGPTTPTLAVFLWGRIYITILFAIFENTNASNIYPQACRLSIDVYSDPDWTPFSKTSTYHPSRALKLIFSRGHRHRDYLDSHAGATRHANSEKKEWIRIRYLYIIISNMYWPLMYIFTHLHTQACTHKHACFSISFAGWEEPTTRLMGGVITTDYFRWTSRSINALWRDW